MKREELTALNVPEEAIDKIMEINGRDIEKHKAAAEVAKAKAEELSGQLGERENDLAELKKVDADGLKAKLEELQGEYEKKRAEWEEKEKQRAYEDRRREFFAGVEFADDYAKRGVLAEFDEKAFQYSDSDGTFRGAKDWLEKLKETAPSAFKAGAPAPQIVRPASGDGGMQVSKEAFAKMGYRERLELKKNNPEIYERVKE